MEAGNQKSMSVKEETPKQISPVENGNKPWEMPDLEKAALEAAAM